MTHHKNRWRGLREEAQAALQSRDYQPLSLPEALCEAGLEAHQLIESRAEIEATGGWIPGVEVYQRPVLPQRFRGLFSELGRAEDGRLGEIGLWPRQWATTRMFGGTAKGFHIHPPYIPEEGDPESWIRGLFGSTPKPPTARPYDREQWDVIHILDGRIEMVLIDERAGMPRKMMAFYIRGDDQCGACNVGIVIPPGVAHAMQVEGAGDAIMVYGTSTVFDPAAEGRIAAGIEKPPFPPEWAQYRGRV